MTVLRIILLPLLVLALGGLAGYFMRADPGYILVSWGNWSVELSLWAGLSAFLLVVLVLVLLRALLKLLGRLRPNHEAQGVRLLERGILSFLEMRLRRARRYLTRGEGHSPLPWINQLLLARIAQAEKDNPASAAWLEKATEEHPHMELASGLLLLLSAYESRQMDLALAHAKRLAQSYPDNPFVLRLLRDIYVQLEDWSELMQLQPRLIKAGRRTAEDWQADMVTGLADAGRPGTAAKLQRWWKQLTREQRDNDELCYHYLSALTRTARPGTARTALEQTLRQNWDTRLLRLYAQLETAPRERLEQLERWYQEKPHTSELMLVLGRLCLQQNLWGKARDYFQEGVRTAPTAELKLELARLSAAMGEKDTEKSLLADAAMQLLPLPELPQPQPAEPGSSGPV